MATRKVKVGDKVSHEGNWIGHDHEDGDFVVVSQADGGSDPSNPLMRVKDFFTFFENVRFKVKAITADLVWLEEDGAWMLPGRLITRDQRKAYCILTEQSSCSPKVHQSARYALLQDADATVLAMVQAVADREAEKAAQVSAAAGEVTNG